MTNAWDLLLTDVQLATMVENASDYGAIRDAAIAVKNGRIAWLGCMDELTESQRQAADQVESGNNQWLSPGLIDCHTHIIYAGNRASEFEMRLKGATYEELQKAGGGILSTVKATRDASMDELALSAAKRIARLKSEGVTTLEVKSGYGLELNTELKMLRVARQLDQQDREIELRTTFLGAHALPQEYNQDREGYLEILLTQILPEVSCQGLADAVDGFCEHIGFSPEEISRLFVLAKELGLPLKLHADQLSDLGAAGLAAEHGALSADHLEYSSEASIKKMAMSGTVAVLLPGAFYVLREKQKPALDLLRKHGVAIAVATDANPGSSPVLSLLLMMNMACTLFSLTAEEALAGVTRNAARALGLGEDRGTLEVGKRADFVLWDIQDPAELAYMIGANPCSRVYKDGLASNVA
ncbi:MAG: imidazolonepropionase [Gammaproteobacteria bacterium]|nr:imidazolonepropionase [Gammaproteobacteria bacterium]